MAFAAGTRLTAELLNETFGEDQSTAQDTSGTTTSTVFTTTLTGGTACSLVFTAPRSGKVAVSHSANIKNSTTNYSGAAFRIREGGTVGSGTIFLDNDDNTSIAVRGTDEVQMGREITITGLTPGQVYNIQEFFRINAASTMTILRKRLRVIPIPQ